MEQDMSWHTSMILIQQPDPGDFVPLLEQPNKPHAHPLPPRLAIDTGRSSLSKENFKRAVQFWETVGRENEPPYFGWLSSRLPLYPETLSLKTNVHTRPVGQRPFIELEPTDHPLAVEQRNGITMARVREIAAALLHGTDGGRASRGRLPAKEGVGGYGLAFLARTALIK
jgi:hypothetical protein